MRTELLSEIAMSIFFAQNRTYIVHDSLVNFRLKVESIANRTWHDFSDNIVGKIEEDNKFSFTHKWCLAYIEWIERSPAYLTGTLASEGNKTIVKCTVRPNSVFIISLYLSVIIFLWVLFGKNGFANGPKLFLLAFLPLGLLIVYGVMKYYTTRLLNRFENKLKLKQDI